MSARANFRGYIPIGDGNTGASHLTHADMEQTSPSQHGLPLHQLAPQTMDDGWREGSFLLSLFHKAEIILLLAG